jgi:hypothetical protein
MKGVEVQIQNQILNPSMIARVSFAVLLEGVV